MQYIQIYGLITHKYWDLKDIDSKDNSLFNLIKNSTKIRINKNKKIGILYPESKATCILATITKKATDNMNTFSYNILKKENMEYIILLKKHFKIDNYNIISDNKVLNSLNTSVLLSRDMPGLPYTDSKTLEFLLAIKNNGIDTCLSSLYVDELFKKIYTPFSLSTDIRGKLINKNIIDKETLDKYLQLLYNEITKDMISANPEKKIQKYINIKWNISSLAERFNQIASNIDIDIFMPYLDYRIIEYVYNLEGTDHTKLINSIYKKFFTESVHKENRENLNCNLDYINVIEHELKKILNDSTSKLLKLVDKNYVLELIKTKGNNLPNNLEDKLISYTEILAYLIQIEYWLNIYDVKIEF